MSEVDYVNYDPWTVMRSMGAKPIEGRRTRGGRFEILRLTNDETGMYVELSVDNRKAETRFTFPNYWGEPEAHNPSRFRPLPSDIEVMLACSSFPLAPDDYWPRKHWTTGYKWWSDLDEHHKKLQAAIGSDANAQLILRCKEHWGADELDVNDGLSNYYRAVWDGGIDEPTYYGITSISYVQHLTPEKFRTGWQVNLVWTTEPVTEDDFQSLARVMRKRELTDENQNDSNDED